MESVAVYGCAAAAAAAVLLIVTFLLTFRNKATYEETVLKQRKELIQPIVRQKRSDGKRERKSAEISKKRGKKTAESEGTESKVPVPAVAVSAPEADVKHDHVDFKVANEVIPLDAEHEQQLSQRKVRADEKPKKPILTNRTDASDVSDAGSDVRIQVSRTNSFDVMHPKDEYELIRSQQSLQTRDPGAKKQQSVLHQALSGDDAGEKTRVREAKRKVKSANVTAKSSVNDSLTAGQLVDLVKSLALSDDETQLVVDALLNNQSESQWSQRNDPIAQLKKTLLEKDNQLKVETESREALKARIGELRSELAAEKTQLQLVTGQRQHLQQELQKTQSGLRTSAEQHRSELVAVQNKVRSECTAKAAASLNRVQEENNRLKDLVQKLEFDRSALDAIPLLQRELEQLRAERQQVEVSRTVLQQQNDDLIHEISTLKEQLSALTTGRQQDEFAMKQQLLDLQSTIREREVGAQAMADELKQTRDQLSQLNRDLDQLQDQDASSRQSLARSTSESLRIANENNDLQTQVRKANDQIEEMRAKVSHLEEELCRVRSTSDEQSARFEALELESQSLRKAAAESDEFRSKNRDSEERIAALSLSETGLKGQLSDLRTQLSAADQEKDSVLQSLTSSFAHLSLHGLSLEQTVQKVVKELQSNAGSQQELQNLRSRNQQLEQEIATFTNSLKQTEESLKEIESRAQAEQKSWSERLRSEQEETGRIQLEKGLLTEENNSLKQTVSDLQSIQATVVDMEQKLIDLQSKLCGEEATKQDLSDKLSEVRMMSTAADTEVREASARTQALKQEAEDTAKQLQEARAEAGVVHELKTQIQVLQQELDNEKKALKEAHSQAVKLRSLVKIGEDSLRAEMKRTDELMDQLKLRNGSAISTPCLTTNGSSHEQESVSGSISSSSLNPEDKSQ